MGLIPSFDNFEFPELTAGNVSKIHKIITAVLVIALAFLSARLVAIGISSFVGQFEASKPQRNTAITKKKNVKKNIDTLEKYDVIITRNIFNSKNEIPDDEFLDTKDMSAGTAKKSMLGIELLGTIVVNDPSRSVAAIKIKKDKEVGAFVVNDVILGKATIISIARKKVLFKNNVTGALEYIEVDDSKVSDLATKKVSQGGIRMLSEDHILVDKGEVDRAMQNINELLVQARAVPHMENGKVAGFKIFGIKPGSLYEKIGAKNGDIIKSVNGIDIKDPASAMGLYNQLQSRDKFEINLEREGQNKTFQIDIR